MIPGKIPARSRCGPIRLVFPILQQERKWYSATSLLKSIPGPLFEFIIARAEFSCNGNEEISWQITVFFRIKNVNIFPATAARIRRISAACFATAPCMRWGISAAETFPTQMTALKIAPIACVPTAGKTMMPSLTGWTVSWNLRKRIGKILDFYIMDCYNMAVA